MEGSFQIGKVLGIPIRLHFSFLLIIPLFAWIIGIQISLIAGMLSDFSNIPIDTQPLTEGLLPYILGMIIAVGLFVGVFLHELTHSYFALKKGIKIKSITLLLFGGVAEIEEGTPDPSDEFLIAIVGPISSGIIGAVCIGIAYLSDYLISNPAWAAVMVFIFWYLGLLNLLLFGFNLIPAFPMDGGRVLRAYLAKRMDKYRATRIAANIGKVFAIFFGIWGIVSLNFIIVIIALFIFFGAEQESKMTLYTSLLEGIQISDVMTKEVTPVSPSMPVTELINTMYTYKHLGFPVIEGDAIVGIVALEDINKASEVDREAMQVKDIMTREVITLSPDQPLTEALQKMAQKNIGRIPIVTDGKVVGIVTRSDLLRMIQLKES